MAKGKKYDCRILQDNTGWTAEIIRRATSSRIVVSKKQAGFSTESEAQKWGQSELKLFLLNLEERNKRRSK